MLDPKRIFLGFGSLLWVRVGRRRENKIPSNGYGGQVCDSIEEGRAKFQASVTVEQISLFLNFVAKQSRENQTQQDVRNTVKGGAIAPEPSPRWDWPIFLLKIEAMN